MQGSMVLVGLGVFAMGIAGWLQAAPVDFDGQTYTQTFDSLTWKKTTLSSSYSTDFSSPNSGTQGWAATSTGHALTNYRYLQHDWTYSAPALYVGAPLITSSTAEVQDKAIAFLGPTKNYFGVCLTNNTGQPITSVHITYEVELWRTVTGTASPLIAEYNTGSYAFGTEPFTGFSNPTQFDSFSFAQGTEAGTTATREFTLAVDWQPEKQLLIRWTFASDFISTNHIVAIDNFVLSVPEPSIGLLGAGMAIGGLSIRRRA